MTSTLEKRYPPIKLSNGTTDAINPETLRNDNSSLTDFDVNKTMFAGVSGADYGNGNYTVTVGAMYHGSNKTSSGATITDPAIGGLFKIFDMNNSESSVNNSESSVNNTLRIGLNNTNFSTLNATGASSYNYVHNTQSDGILILYNQNVSNMTNDSFFFQNGQLSSSDTESEYYGALNGNNAFTIDFYFSTVQSGPNRAMFSVGGSQVDAQSFTIYMHNGTIKISAGGANYSVDFSDSFSNLNNGKIYHLRCRYKGYGKSGSNTYIATNEVELKIVEAGQNIKEASYVTKSFLPSGTVLNISTATSDQLIYFGRQANNSSTVYNFIGKLHYSLSISHYDDYVIDAGYEASTNNRAVDNYYMTNFIKDASKTHSASGTDGIPGQWISLKLPSANETEVGYGTNGIIPTKFYIGGRNNSSNEPFPKTITVLGSSDGTNYTTIVDNAHKQLKDGTFDILVEPSKKTYNEFVFIFTQLNISINYLEITEMGVYGYEATERSFIDNTGFGGETIKPIYQDDFTSQVFDGNMFSYVNITPEEDISGSTPFTIELNYSTDTVNDYLGPIFSMGRDNVVAGNYTIEQNTLAIPTNDHYTWRLNNTHYISYANMLPNTTTTSTNNDVAVNVFDIPHDNSINLLPDINTTHQLVVSSDGSYNVNFMLDGKIVKTEVRQTTDNLIKPNNLNNGKDSMFNISIGQRTPKFSFNTPYNGSNIFYFDGTAPGVINLNDSGNITRDGTTLFSNSGFAWMTGNDARTVTLEMKTTSQNSGDVILIGTGSTGSTNGKRFNVKMNQNGNLSIGTYGNDTLAASHGDIRDGQWHFVSISWDGTNIQIYLDKILVLTESLSALDTPDNGGVAYLGANVNRDNKYTGYLRNVHFYNGNIHNDSKFKGQIHRVAVYKDLFIDDPQKIKLLDVNGNLNVNKIQNNTDLKIHSTGALQIPNHTIDPEIITPEQSKGSIYYNTTFNCYKGYDGTSWKVIKGGITNESGTVYANSDTNVSLFTSHIGQNAVLDISMGDQVFADSDDGERLLIDVIGIDTLKGAKNPFGTPLSIVLKVKFDGDARNINTSQHIIRRFFDFPNIENNQGYFGTSSSSSDWARGYVYSSSSSANNDTINALAGGTDNPTVLASKDYIAIISYNGNKTITYTIYNETDGSTAVSISETQDYYQNLTLNDGFDLGGNSSSWFEGKIYYIQIHHHYFSSYSAFTNHVDGYIVLSLSSVNEDITMTNYGNVGIGTTNPQTTLDVNGSIGVSTDIDFYDPMYTSARGSVRYNNQVAVPHYGFILNENHVPDYSFILNGNLASVTDVYGSGASLELKGGATTSYHGVQLDGVNDYINIPNSILSFTGNFTLSLWIEAKQARNLTRIFSGGHDDSPSFNLMVASNSKSIGIFNKDTSESGLNVFSTAQYAVDGIIHNYVISRTGGKMRLFIDGIKKLEYSNNKSFVNIDSQIGYAIPLDAGIYAKCHVYRFDIWNNKGFSSVNDAKIIFDGGYNIQFLPLSTYQSISLEHENATIGNGDYNNKLTISDGVTLSMNNGTSLDFNKTTTRIKNGKGNAELNIGGSVTIGNTYDSLQENKDTLCVEGAVGIGTTSISENDNMVIYDKTLSKDAVNISKMGSVTMDNSGGFNNEKMLYFPPCKIRPSSFKTLAHANLTNANGTSQTSAPNAEQIDVYFDVSQNNLSYGRGRYYLSMASVETNNLGYKHLFSGIPSSGDSQHLVSEESNIYPASSYRANTNAPNYQNLNIYGWWFSLKMPNPITLSHFTVNLEKGSYPVDRRIKRVFVIATNDNGDYYKLGYFGGAGVHGSSVISSDANVEHFSYYAEQGKNMQSSPFLKYIFIVTQTNGAVNNVALSSFRIYGSQGKLKIHQSLNASRAYIGNKKPYFSYGVNNPITFDDTEVNLTDEGFKCIKGKAPRTFEFEINSIFNLSEGTTSNGNTTQFSNFIATGNRYNNKQTFNIRQAKDKLGIVRYGGLVHVNWDLSENEVFDGHWHHYRITYDNDYFACYVDNIKRPALDGVHNNSDTESTDGYTIKDKSGEMNTEGDTNRIGRSNDNNYRNPFFGQMRNIHFYDHVSEGSITFDVTSSSQTSKMIMDNANAPNYLNTQGPNRIEIDDKSGIGVQMHLTSHDANTSGMGTGSINYISEGDHHVFETENSFMDLNKQRLYLPGPVNYNDLSLNNNYKCAEDFVNTDIGLNVNGSIYVDGPWADGNPPTATDLSNRVFGAVDANGYAKNNLIDGKISNTYTCFDGTQSIYNHDVSGGYKDYAIVNLEETTLTNKNYTTFMHLDGEGTYFWNGGTDNFVVVNQTYAIKNQTINATEVIPTNAYMGGDHLDTNTGGTGYVVTLITKVGINDYLFGYLDTGNVDAWKMVRIDFAIENNNVKINSIDAKKKDSVTAPVTDASNIDYWNNPDSAKTTATSFTAGELGIYNLEFQIKNYTSEPYFTHGNDQELYFDGTESSVINLAHLGLTCVKGSNPRTIEFDFKTSSTSTNVGLISTGYGQTTATSINGASFNIKLNNGALSFMGFSIDYTSSNATGLNDNNWHTVKVTYSKPYLSFFVDNVLTDRVASGGSYDGTLINTQDDNNVLGRSNDMYDGGGGLTEAHYYTGYLRNVRFYDYAQNDNDYNIIYSYVPNFEQNDSYATYSYYKTHGKDCSQYSLFNSDLSLGVGKAPSGASAVTFEPWTNFIKQNVLMLGEPNSSNNDSTQFVSLPKEETDELILKDGFSIMIYAEVVKGNDYTGDDATILFDLGSTSAFGFGIRVLYWTDDKYHVNIKDSDGGSFQATSSEMSAPSGINCFVLAIKNDSAKFYLNGALLVTNTNATDILDIPNGDWSIGSCATATDSSWPMKIYNVVTFGKELSINEINTIKCFSDNNTLSPLINTNKCAYGNTTIDVNRTITNAIVERNVQYIYNHNIKKISICPEHDARPSMLRATRIVTNSKPANGSVDVNHLELQGSDILGGSSIHLNAAQKVIIDGNLTITQNVYDMSGGIKSTIFENLQINSDSSAPGFQIFANNEDIGMKIDASDSDAQNPLIMGTSTGSAANRNIAFSKNAGLHIQPDGQAGVNNQNQRGTIDTHRGLDVSGTVFGIYPVGSIMMYPYQVDNISNNLPPGWKLCDGIALSITDYSELYAIIANDYGGNGSTTFKLPNFNTNYYAFGLYNSNTATTFGNNSMETNSLTSHSHSVGTRSGGDLSFNNVSGSDRDKITYVTSNNSAMGSNYRLPFFKQNQRGLITENGAVAGTPFRNLDWRSNGNRRTHFSHIYNIITPAGTSIANQNTPDNIMNNAINSITTDNTDQHLRFHDSTDNVLDISNQNVTVTHSLTSNNTGSGDPWLPNSTQMKSIIYTGVL